MGGQGQTGPVQQDLPLQGAFLLSWYLLPTKGLLFSLTIQPLSLVSGKN